MSIGRQGRVVAPPLDFFVVAPVDVAFGPPGTDLYVADFSSGQITVLRACAP